MLPRDPITKECLFCGGTGEVAVTRVSGEVVQITCICKPVEKKDIPKEAGQQ